MNCAEFEEILHDLDRPGTGGLGKREEALAHAESCGGCGLLMMQAESLDFGLRQLAMEDSEKSASRAVEAALRAGFRKARAAEVRRRSSWQIAALAAAAVILLMLGISLWHRFGEAPGNRNDLRAPTNAQQVSPNQNTTAVNSGAVNPGAVNSGNPETNPSEQAASDASDDESATAFVALPFADDPDAVQDGEVVRVVLTRTALASLGVPTLGTGSSDQIPADLLLSDDGTPEAIRLVSQAEIQ
jgi:hypothetical protein